MENCEELALYGDAEGLAERVAQMRLEGRCPPFGLSWISLRSVRRLAELATTAGLERLFGVVRLSTLSHHQRACFGVAALYRSDNMLDLLLHHGLDPDMTVDTEDSITLLMSAAFVPNMEAIDRLLNAGADPHKFTEWGNVLMACAGGRREKHARLLEKFLELGVSPNRAVVIGSSSIVPLDSACDRRHRPSIRLLLKYGAHLSDSFLHEQITNSNVEAVTELLEHDNSLASKRFGGYEPFWLNVISPIDSHLCSTKRRTKIAKLLLRAGARVDDAPLLCVPNPSEFIRSKGLSKIAEMIASKSMA